MTLAEAQIGKEYRIKEIDTNDEELNTFLFYLLPPNMRAISRFMNMSSWVFWANEMLDRHDTLPEKMQEAYAFIKDYESLLKELQTVLCAVRQSSLSARTKASRS